MSFFDRVIRLRFEYSSGMCECKEKDHGHVGRCFKVLYFDDASGQSLGSWKLITE